MTDRELLIPVGHDLGVLFSGVGPEQRWQQVRVGAEVTELDDPEYAVWLLAHGADDADRPTRTSLAQQATLIGLEADVVELTIERFLVDGLLAAVDPAGDNALEFSREHQLFPLLYELGADPDEPCLRTVGMLNQPVARVSNAVYDVWAWAHLAPELWSGCQDAARVAVQAGATSPEETEPRAVLSGILRQVHGLLSVRAAYFDRRRMR